MDPGSYNPPPIYRTSEKSQKNFIISSIVDPSVTYGTLSGNTRFLSKSLADVAYRGIGIDPHGIIKDTPDPLLVGIETNPGPKNNKLAKLQKQIKSLSTALVKSKPAKKKKSKKSVSVVRSISAPAALGSIISLKPPLVSHIVKNGKPVKIVSGTQYVTTICSSNTNAPQFNNVAASANANTFIAIDIAGTADTGGAVNLVVSGSPLYNEGLSFGRFLFRKLRFHYRTATATSAGGGFTLAYAADTYAYSQSTIGNNSRQLLSQLEDNVTFACWENATLDCTAVKGSFIEPRYDITAGSAGSANSRMEGQGCLLISSGTNTSNASITYGDLLMEYEVELYDSGPFNSSGVALSAKVFNSFMDAALRNPTEFERLYQERKKRLIKIEEHNEKKDEVIVTKPPSVSSWLTSLLE